MSFFWRPSINAVQGIHELRQANRTQDKCLEYVLELSRKGAETWEVYCFTHGLPTRNVGCWHPWEAKLKCGNPTCAKLFQTWEHQLLEESLSWPARQSQECEMCKDERRRRCRIIVPGGYNDGAHMQSCMVPIETLALCTLCDK